jgi:hypothetical protein
MRQKVSRDSSRMLAPGGIWVGCRWWSGGRLRTAFDSFSEEAASEDMVLDFNPMSELKRKAGMMFGGG